MCVFLYVCTHACVHLWVYAYLHLAFLTVCICICVHLSYIISCMCLCVSLWTCFCVAFWSVFLSVLICNVSLCVTVSVLAQVCISVPVFGSLCRPVLVMGLVCGCPCHTDPFLFHIAHLLLWMEADYPFSSQRTMIDLDSDSNRQCPCAASQAWLAGPLRTAPPSAPCSCVLNTLGWPELPVLKSMPLFFLLLTRPAYRCLHDHIH